MAFVFARKKQAAVEWATVTDGTPGSFKSVGCIEGSPAVNRSFATETSPARTDWCSTQEEQIAKVQLGAYTHEVTFTVHVEPDDGDYASLNDAFIAGDDIALRVTLSEGVLVAGVPAAGDDAHVMTYIGKLTSGNIAVQGGNEEDITDVTYVFHGNERVLDDIITGT